jgi:hypothetical protein
MISQYGDYFSDSNCHCEDYGKVKSGTELGCSQADFFVSLAYFPTKESKDDDDDYYDDYNDDNHYDIFDFALDLSNMRTLDPKNGDIKIVEMFHTAQRSSSSESFDALCKGNCTLFTVNFYGDQFNSMNFFGTPTYLMFNNTEMIACANGIYNSEAFDPLITKSPVPLVQGYYVCKPNITVAVQRALGIAAGSASLYSSVVLSVCLFFSVFVYNLIAKDKIINPAQKKKIIEDEMIRLSRDLNNLIESNQKLQRKVQQIHEMEKLNDSITTQSSMSYVL